MKASLTLKHVLAIQCNWLSSSQLFLSMPLYTVSDAEKVDLEIGN